MATTRTNKKPVHPAVKLVLEQILAAVKVALKQGDTQATLAEKCDITHQQMNRLIRGLRGSNLTLNMAFKIWEGLGKRFDYLFPGPVPDGLMGKTVEIYQGSDADLLKQFVEILYNKESFVGDFATFSNLVSVAYNQLRAKINEKA